MNRPLADFVELIETILRRSSRVNGRSEAISVRYVVGAWLLQTLCLVVALPAGASGDERLDTEPLVRIAVRHGVPMPPNTAPLVLAGTGQTPEVYSPAFLLEARADGSALVLRGFRREALSRNDRRDPVWRPFTSKMAKVDFHRISTFVTAVQLAQRGDEETAQLLWKQVVDVREWSDRKTDQHHAYETEPPALFLGRCILDDLRSAYWRPGADWREINRRRRALTKEIFNLDWDARATIYGDLLETLYARPPERSSVEALLLAWSRRPHDHEPYWYFDEGDPCRDSRPEAPAREILLRGFDAIPDLLKLVGDQRLTAHQTQMGEDYRVNPRVGDLAQNLLSEITGRIANDGTGGAHAFWTTWWERARTRPEADVLQEAVFSRDRQKITGVNEGPARILAHKYPARLAPLFDEFVESASPQAQPFFLAEAMMASSLPEETKMRVLIAGAAKGSLENKRSLLQILAKTDSRKCAELVLPILRNLPVDSDGPYWTCAPAHFSHVVMQIEDDEVWRVFLAAAKRSSVGLRLEMMNPMDYGYIRDKNRDRRLAFLAAFLDDATVRRLPAHQGFGLEGKFDGPCAAFTFPEIEVRNSAAMELACILDMCDSADSSWTSAQWAGLRAKVRAKLARMKLPNLEASPAGQ